MSYSFHFSNDEMNVFWKKIAQEGPFSGNKEILKILSTSVGFEPTPLRRLLHCIRQATNTTRPQFDPPPAHCLIFNINLVTPEFEQWYKCTPIIFTFLAHFVTSYYTQGIHQTWDQIYVHIHKYVYYHTRMAGCEYETNISGERILWIAMGKMGNSIFIEGWYF